MKFDLVKIASIASNIIALLALAWSIYKANEDKRIFLMDSAQSSEEASKHVVNLIPLLLHQSNLYYKDIEVTRKAMEICLKRLAEFPVDKIQPSAITEYLIQIQISGSRALDFSKGGIIKLSGEEAGHTLSEANDSLRKLQQAVRSLKY